MRTLTLFGATVAAVAIALPGAALAHKGPPIDVFTETVTGSDVLLFAGPCGGGPGTVSVEFHDKFHVTAFADGHVVLSANQVGTFEFEPFDTAQPARRVDTATALPAPSRRTLEPTRQSSMLLAGMRTESKCASRCGATSRSQTVR